MEEGETLDETIKGLRVDHLEEIVKRVTLTVRDWHIDGTTTRGALEGMIIINMLLWDFGIDTD